FFSLRSKKTLKNARHHTRIRCGELKIQKNMTYYDIINDAVKEETIKCKFNRPEINDLQETFALEGEDSCWERAEKCGKHLLASIIFRENSQHIINRTDSILLPTVGFYYSFFHAAAAIYWLKYSIKKDDITKVSHSKLQRLLKEKFVDKKHISSYFLDVMSSLQDIREISNYTVQPYLYSSTGLKEQNLYEGRKLYDVVGKFLDECISYVDEVNKYSHDIFDFKQQIKTYIGDASGDDILLTYVSKNEKEIIWFFLVQHD
ncbi:MAG: hypothetical protein KAI79_14930, partial [Bacteroidales bacterium]|nr:hypothetical protein [Bacteroidales bacterium]